jgi:predicted metal-dependent phosphoesterase TrpH
MGSIIDMHVHTIVGSMDSDISPKRLGEQAREAGLTGVALTEHLHQWDPSEVARFREETGLFVFNAREWSTDMGHIGVFGLPASVKGIRHVSDLRRACDDYGAVMVLCHPFRYFPGPSSLLFGQRRDAGQLPVEELAEHPVFSMADAVEVLNGGCIERENRLAQEAAAALSLATTGGSDAHMPMEVGRYATVFDRDFETEEGMLEELRAGRFRAARRVGKGEYMVVDAVGSSEEQVASSQ